MYVFSQQSMGEVGGDPPVSAICVTFQALMAERMETVKVCGDISPLYNKSDRVLYDLTTAASIETVSSSKGVVNQ